MKVVAKPIEVVSYTDNKGDVKPLRIRIQNDDETLNVIRVDKVITKQMEKLAGNYMLVLKCESLIDNTSRLFEIKYELHTCKWILFKI